MLIPMFFLDVLSLRSRVNFCSQSDEVYEVGIELYTLKLTHLSLGKENNLIAKMMNTSFEKSYIVNSANLIYCHYK